MQFGNLRFSIEDGKVTLTEFGTMTELGGPFAEVQVAGENRVGRGKMVYTSEAERLNYVGTRQEGDTLTVTQQSPYVRVDTRFTTYADTDAVRVTTTVTNITDEPIALEEVGIFCLSGFGKKATVDALTLTKFMQSHHVECRAVRHTLREWGMCPYGPIGQQRVSESNVGSWSTKEALPMGILEGEFGALMWQIENNHSWHWEVADSRGGRCYLYLGGPSLPYGGWSKRLAVGESYTTPAAAIALGSDVNAVIAEMTRYRRHIAGHGAADSALPTIFNEYMHLSWDSPTAENTAVIAPVAAKTGVEYYVIDCGWHNEEPGNVIYPYVGQWRESHARFPDGLRRTTDLIRSLGMKPGLWIEPEIIGMQCEDMLAYYDDDCFYQRYGKRVTTARRHFLDYRNERVRDYMTETIRRMVEDYGAAYIKCDYNQDCGVGTDRDADTAGEGLERATAAYFDWLREMMRRYPDVIFEGCASGGMRMDYQTLSAFHLLSTSDQTDYRLYPYIAGNVLAAVLPEQAAVWSYPVTANCDGAEVTDDRIVMNMVNSLLGRMHLASHLERLDERQMALVREGVAYYNTLTPIKKRAVPYFPLGFTAFDDQAVCAGLRDGNRLYLAAWDLHGAGCIHLPTPKRVTAARVAYPSASEVTVEITDGGVDITFPRVQMAAFIEIELA